MNFAAEPSAQAAADLAESASETVFASRPRPRRLSVVEAVRRAYLARQRCQKWYRRASDTSLSVDERLRAAHLLARASKDLDRLEAAMRFPWES